MNVRGIPQSIHYSPTFPVKYMYTAPTFLKESLIGPQGKSYRTMTPGNLSTAETEAAHTP